MNFIKVFLVYVISFAFFYHLQFLTPFFPDPEGYYHGKLGMLYRTLGFLKTFPWSVMSVWAQYYSDKVLLFHLYMAPFTYFSDMFYGIKIATVILGSFVPTSFYWILRLNKVRMAWVWTFLLLSSGTYFLFRVNVSRPQIMAMSLGLWSIHFIINQRFKSMAILVFFYTKAYTAFHYPLVLSLIQSFYLWIFDGKRSFKMPLVIFIAIITGMLIHPSFPNNFVIFYIHNILLPFYKFSQVKVLSFGQELMSIDSRQFIKSGLAVVIPLFFSFLFLLHKKEKTDQKTRVMFVLAMALLVVTIFSIRFAEYSYPAILMFCALLLDPYLSSLSMKRVWPVGFILAALFYKSYLEVFPLFKNVSESRYKQAALFLQQNTEPGEIVYTCDWDDAAEIIFYNHYNRYLLFLDPIFLYAWNIDAYYMWGRLASGGYAEKGYDILKNNLKMKYGLCTNNFNEFKQRIKDDSRMKIIFEDDQMYVFKLES